MIFASSALRQLCCVLEQMHLRLCAMESASCNDMSARPPPVLSLMCAYCSTLICDDDQDGIHKRQRVKSGPQPTAALRGEKYILINCCGVLFRRWGQGTVHCMHGCIGGRVRNGMERAGTETGIQGVSEMGIKGYRKLK